MRRNQTRDGQTVAQQHTNHGLVTKWNQLPQYPVAQPIDVTRLPSPKEATFYSVTYAFIVPGFIKIGRCDHIRRRLRALQSGNPIGIQVLGWVDGNRESEIHEWLLTNGIARVCGEWFEDTEMTRHLLRIVKMIEPAFDFEAALIRMSF